jgi:hypothetical protein
LEGLSAVTLDHDLLEVDDKVERLFVSITKSVSPVEGLKRRVIPPDTKSLASFKVCYYEILNEGPVIDHRQWLVLGPVLDLREGDRSLLGPCWLMRGSRMAFHPLAALLVLVEALLTLLWCLWSGRGSLGVGLGRGQRRSLELREPRSEVALGLFPG